MKIAVDFDGTIVQHKYPFIGKEKPFAVATLRQLQADGHQLILWTVRSGDLLKEAIDWCAQRGLTFYAVNSNLPQGSLFAGKQEGSPKIQADVFIDDANVGGLPEWGEIYQQITGKVHQHATRRKRPRWLRKLLGR